MTAPCPISWMRLELYALGEGSEAERAQIAAHFDACEACKRCLETIEADARPLAPLVLPPVRPRPGDGRTDQKDANVRWLRRAAKVGAALAFAAGLFVLFEKIERPRVHEMGAQEDPTRTKGTTIAFMLVRDDDVEIVEAGGMYRDGDRFKARVTCPAELHASWDLVVLENGEASFPLAPQPDLLCGNGVALPGAFRLMGRKPMTLCLVHREGGLVDRDDLRRNDPSIAPDAVCKVLTPAP